VHQGWLLGRDEPRCDPTFARMTRIRLDAESWIELAPGWLDGHATLFEELRATVAWREESRQMYDRVVDVPRQIAVLRRLARRLRGAHDARGAGGDGVGRRAAKVLDPSDGRRRVAGAGARVRRSIGHGRRLSAHASTRDSEGRARRAAHRHHVSAELGRRRRAVTIAA
jgi:hypothetical protein